MLRIAALLMTLCLPVAAAAQQITVFAAASLRGTLEEIAQQARSDLRLSFGGSGSMARQVAAGAPADVVILASTHWMDWLTDQGLRTLSTPTAIAGNTLVLITAKDAAPLASLDEIAARLGNGRLAMGQRDAVPAGSYARQWLQHAGVWNTLTTRLAETDNVRAALALVARGETPLGIVYASDAIAEPQVQALLRAPSDAHDPITYLAASLSPAGDTYIANLRTPASAAIFAKHGFEPVPE
ncbi:molybdate ABC transporter substrate-binding protein [Sulfitobacter geojensis]|uniref:molybdate ABC transporter substrate-binding protein n=1 Tax=Sulfitobacter geojensis TaxID=1342299 RepID=UPI0007D926DC|nr:molybdate ABC transporter substrate-binding protein [Sulfitobacter geojensis]OAN95148.1 molybdate ABC transporter substrate-binding protein [Sulfitobacter geojensis]